MRALLPLLSACAAPTLEVPVPDLGLDPDITRVVVTVHGAGRDPSGWATDAAAEAVASAVDPGWEGLAWDWADDATSTVRAVDHGLVHGEALGSALADADLVHVLLVGHSAGAAVVHAATQAVVAGSDATVHAVYLDPFLGRGLSGWGWGVDRYGVEATAAEHLLHTDDPVPATGRPLTAAWVADVSGAAVEDPDLPGHDVPIAVWRASLGDPGAPVGWPLSALGGADPTAFHDTRPRGTVEDVIP